MTAQSMQAEFDWEAAAANYPRELAAEQLRAAAREEFSQDRLCLAWITQSDGRAWLDWWRALPEYQRRSMVIDYEFERDTSRRIGREMRPYNQIYQSQLLNHQHFEDMAQSWAVQIKQAAVERQPVPFTEAAHMTGLERIKFRMLLARAFQIAGVVIIAPPAETAPSHK